jgi:hypothetical protein
MKLTQEERALEIEHICNLHKSIYGIKPRDMALSTMTNAQLVAFTKSLQETPN